jgi:Tol biopolymer transport system component
MHRRAALPVTVLIALTLSCGDSTGPSRDPGIHIVAGANVTDTVGAVLDQALIVEVRDDDGNLAPAGTVVRFESIPVGFFGLEAAVSPLSAQGFGSLATPETDAGGRAAVRVQLGFKAGPARIRIAVPELGFVDTATFTVEAGNAFGITVTPVDTLIYVGETYTVTATVIDRHLNPRDDAVTWAASATGISITNAGVVSANQIGRYQLTATSAATPDAEGIAAVSVLVPLRLAAWNPGNGRIVSQELDGTDSRTLANVVDGGIGAFPSWIPGTQNVIFSAFDGSLQRLYVATPTGTVNPWMASLPAEMSHQAEPAPSADGNWIFFSAFNTACGSAGDYCIHRATPSGAAPTLLGIDFPSRQPAPSPDGSKVAFVRDDFSNQIRVFDIGANAVSSWSVSGSRPSWSPTGTKIAFVSNGRINTVNPDGSGIVTVTPTGEFDWSGPLAWSPDGNWILARHFGLLKLVEEATGVAMPLPGTTNLFGGALRE